MLSVVVGQRICVNRSHRCCVVVFVIVDSSCCCCGTFG